MPPDSASKANSDSPKPRRLRELNLRLQTELNPAKPEEPTVEKFGWQFRVRDKVIQTENDYDTPKVRSRRTSASTASAWAT